MKRKRYSRKFQRMAVERMRRCENVGELLEALESGDEAPRPSTHAAAYRKENQRLKRLLAEKSLEVDFFRGALQKSRLDARRAAKLASWDPRADPSVIQQIALEHRRRYGYRRITAELRRRGIRSTTNGVFLIQLAVQLRGDELHAHVFFSSSWLES